MVALGGLHEGDEYCAQVVVAGGAPTAQRARFVAGAPTVLAQAASATGTTTAAVNLSIDAASQATSYVVEYALASSPWCRSGQIAETHPEAVTAAASLAQPDGAFHEVTVGLTGLAPGSEYCALGVASNHAGRGSGGPASFRTTAVRTLLVAVGGTGSGAVSGPSISCPGACSSSFPLGVQVTLTASPSHGSTFAGWRGECAGTSTCTVTLSADRSVAAVFTASSSAPPSSPPRRAHAPRVDTRTGEVQLEYEFPETGSAETYGEVLQGATLASVPTSLTPSPIPVEGGRCKKGFVRKGKRCVSNAPVRYGRGTSAISAAGIHVLHIKPTGKALAALEHGKTLAVRAVLVFTPAGTSDRITALTTARVSLRRVHARHGTGKR